MGKGFTLLLVGIRVGEASRLACLAAKQSVQVGASLVRLTLATSVFRKQKEKQIKIIPQQECGIARSAA